LEAFAAGGSLPTQDGRYFNVRIDITLQALRNQIERLKTEGSASVMANIRDARKRGMFDTFALNITQRQQ
jgi:hypothetical protein